ncbi:MAG: uracil-DNA glycosylase [Victivallales bacterium]|nr:uracil-DNA glycosylase [Victivallales bacterium]
MPGSIAEELLRILALQKAKGVRYAWLSPQNAQAFFFSNPQINTRQNFTQPPAAPYQQPPARQQQPPPVQQQPVQQQPVQQQPMQPMQRPSFQTARPQLQPQGPVEIHAAPPAAGMDWEPLKEAIFSCRACPLYAGKKNYVMEDGFRHARVMFIGEGPGEEEDKQGVPFVGRAGQLLTRMIHAMGLDRSAQDAEHGCYIANIVKCRPPGNRNPESDEAAACLPYLKRQIELVKPEAIILLGAVPLNFLMNRKGITAARGKWLDYQGIPVMPTFHPAYLLRFERTREKFIEEKRKVWSDLQQVMARLGLQQPGKP